MKIKELEEKPTFDNMFSDSKQINKQQMATLRGFLEEYRS